MREIIAVTVYGERQIQSARDHAHAGITGTGYGHVADIGRTPCWREEMAAAVGARAEQRCCTAAGVVECWHVHRQEHRVTIFIVVINHAECFAAVLRERITPAGCVRFEINIRVVGGEGGEARAKRKTCDEFSDGRGRICCTGGDGVVKDRVVRIGERKRPGADLCNVRADKSGRIERCTGGAIKASAAGAAVKGNQVAAGHNDEQLIARLVVGVPGRENIVRCVLCNLNAPPRFCRAAPPDVGVVGGGGVLENELAD